MIRTTAVVLALPLLLTGCSRFMESGQDVPIQTRNTDPAQVFNMPDGYGNFAAKCDGPNRVYTIFHGDSPYGAIAVVPNDPRCAK